MKNLFGLLAKYPEAGKVKTRLALDMGGQDAARIYKIIAERVFSNTSPNSDSDFGRTIFYSPLHDMGRFESWLPGELFLPQRGEDIGEVMGNALRDLFELGASKAVITGADIPELNRTIINDAFYKLEHSDVVIGPAEDGGYYLIGMKTEYPEIFRDISWSTGYVFAETIRTIERLGLSYSTVKVLSDVDRIGDIRRYENLFRDL